MDDVQAEIDWHIEEVIEALDNNDLDKAFESLKQARYVRHVAEVGERHSDTSCPPLTRQMCPYKLGLR